jgi:hypothetical protein
MSIKGTQHTPSQIGGVVSTGQEKGQVPRMENPPPPPPKAAPQPAKK